MLVTSKKIKKITDIIEEALEKVSSPYISCSWGKDSTVMLWACLKINSDIPIMFMDSGYYLPDIYEFRNYIIEKWKIKNYIEITGKTDYIQYCKKVGLPGINRINQDASVKKIKKDKADKFLSDNNFDCSFIGIRADESRKRTWLIKKYGHFFQNKNNIFRCYPLAYCTYSDIWNIIIENNIPHCKIYDKTGILDKKQIRSSGWVSTDGANRGQIVWIKKYYPEYFNKLQIEFPIIRSYL